MKYISGRSPRSAFRISDSTFAFSLSLLRLPNRSALLSVPFGLQRPDPIVMPPAVKPTPRLPADAIHLFSRDVAGIKTGSLTSSESFLLAGWLPSLGGVPSGSPAVGLSQKSCRCCRRRGRNRPAWRTRHGCRETARSGRLAHGVTVLPCLACSASAVERSDIRLEWEKSPALAEGESIHGLRSAATARPGGNEVVSEYRP